VSGRRAYELSRFTREEFVDRPRVLALDRLTRQDDGAAIDIGRRELRFCIADADESVEASRIDRARAEKRREDDRRTPNDLELPISIPTVASVTTS
jgi:hypothetical protein